jgi:hypothetical protein
MPGSPPVDAGDLRDHTPPENCAHDVHAFILKDYETVLQSLFRHDESIVSMRNWIVATAFAYFGFTFQASSAQPNHWAVVLRPPLILWCVSYVLTTYERMNSRVLADIVLLLESIFTFDDAQGRRRLVRDYLPMRTRLERPKRFGSKLCYYIASLTDTPVLTWHAVLLVAILATGLILAGTGPCPAQLAGACLPVEGLILVILVAWICRRKALRAARWKLYSKHEIARVRQYGSVPMD